MKSFTTVVVVIYALIFTILVGVAIYMTFKAPLEPTLLLVLSAVMTYVFIISVAPILRGEAVDMDKGYLAGLVIISGIAVNLLGVVGVVMILTREDITASEAWLLALFTINSLVTIYPQAGRN